MLRPQEPAWRKGARRAALDGQRGGEGIAAVVDHRQLVAQCHQALGRIGDAASAAVAQHAAVRLGRIAGFLELMHDLIEASATLPAVYPALGAAVVLAVAVVAIAVVLIMHWQPAIWYLAAIADLCACRTMSVRIADTTRVAK